MGSSDEARLSATGVGEGPLNQETPLRMTDEDGFGDEDDLADEVEDDTDNDDLEEDEDEDELE